jgi:hypothetical protein
MDISLRTHNRYVGQHISKLVASTMCEIEGSLPPVEEGILEEVRS